MFLFLAGIGLRAESLPEWIIPLREAVYEQELKADEVRPLYQTVKTAVQEHFTGAELDTALSRCEYFMGRALQFEKRNSEAGVHYSEGMKLAEKAVTASPSAAAWLIFAENLSQNCAVRTLGYAISNGLDVDKYAKNAIALDKRNAAAQYIVAARWVYAPAPLHNHKKGIQMMQSIITEGDMEKDDMFNVYTAIAYAYIQQKKHADARPWLLQALEIYPSNKYAAELLAKK
jgi:tetratricopeptide (TPR) repeat protein